MPGEEMTPEEQESQVEANGEQGVCIEIHCKPDGTFEVLSEPLEGQEEMGESGDQANSFGEALKMAMQLYKDWSAGGEEAQMSAGFSSVRGGAGE